MIVNLNLKIKKDQTGWSLQGEEFVDGDLVGMSDLSGVKCDDLKVILNQVFFEYE